MFYQITGAKLLICLALFFFLRYFTFFNLPFKKIEVKLLIYSTLLFSLYKYKSYKSLLCYNLQIQKLQVLVFSFYSRKVKRFFIKTSRGQLFTILFLIFLSDFRGLSLFDFRFFLIKAKRFLYLNL